MPWNQVTRMEGNRPNRVRVWGGVCEKGHVWTIDKTERPHAFRRFCATELVRGGANLWHVKELLGHENLDTLQHYVRLTIADLKKTHARCHPRERDDS